MNISSNVLFHFTSKEKLLAILDGKFYPQYCLECYDDLLPSEPIEERNIAIPMVCFCDIPLGQIKEHVFTYGKFGIGLKKEWGIYNKINPVLYAINGTDLTNTIGKIKNDFWSNFFSQEIYDGIDMFDLSKLVMYMKPYKGVNRKTSEQKIFYNEREWRYIPGTEYFKSESDPPLFLKKESFDKNDIRKKCNDAMKKWPFELTFSPDDIEYIIVERDDDIQGILDKISNAKFLFNDGNRELLKTKIITIQKVLSDL